jgi:thymidine phosphorylase
MPSSLRRAHKDFDHNNPRWARCIFEVAALCAGVVAGIDNLQIARIARLAGAPKVQGAGVDLLCKLGEPVRSGEPLYRVHADFPADLEFARQACARPSATAWATPTRCRTFLWSSEHGSVTHCPSRLPAAFR